MPLSSGDPVDIEYDKDPATYGQYSTLELALLLSLLAKETINDRGILRLEIRFYWGCRILELCVG